MDPLSITAGCLALLSAVGKTSVAVTTFIRGCREARSDLTSITGELTQLHLVLDLLKDEASVSDGRVIPESLQVQILSIIKNCSTVVDNINKVLQNHSGKTGVAKWVAFGKSEVAGLRMSLEAHRGSLSLVLELVSVSMAKAIMDDVAVVRNDVHDIRQDTVQIPQIIAELTRLRAIVASGDIPTTARGHNYVLEQYLDSLTSYAETVCNDVVWDSDGSQHSPSRKPSLESVGDSGRPSHAHPGGATAEVPTERSDDNDNHDSSQPSTTAAARLESPNVVSVTTTGQAPDRVWELANQPFLSDFDSLALYGDVVVAGNSSQIPQDSTNSSNFTSKSLPTTAEKTPKPEVAHAADNKSLPPVDASTTRNDESTSAIGLSNASVAKARDTEPFSPLNTGGLRKEYDPYNYTTALTRHAPPAAPLSKVVVLSHEDIPAANSTKKLDFIFTTDESSEGPQSVVTPELEAKREDAPLPDIVPVNEPELPAAGKAPLKSPEAEYRRKLFIVGDGAAGKSTLYM